MILLVHDKNIIEKNSELWNKIKSLIKTEVNSEPCIMINTLNQNQKRNLQ